MAMFSSMLRPAMATRRPWRAAVSITSCTRDRSDANVATTMRPVARANTCWKVSLSWLSEAV